MSTPKYILMMLCSYIAAADILLCGVTGEEGPDPAVPVHTIGASLGVARMDLRDEYVSPYTYGGALFATRLAYRRLAQETRHEIVLKFFTGTIASDVQRRDVREKGGSLSYVFRRPLHCRKTGQKGFEAFIGVGVSSTVVDTDVSTPKDVTWAGAIDESWQWSHALEMHLAGEYVFGERQTVSVAACAPMYRNESRPSPGHWYSPRNREVSDNFWNAAARGSNEFIWDEFSASFEVEYRGRVTERADVTCSYAFLYGSSVTPLPMGMSMNIFFAGIDVRL